MSTEVFQSSITAVKKAKPIPKPRRIPPVPPKPICHVVKFRYQPPSGKQPSASNSSTVYCTACSKRLNTCTSISCTSYCKCSMDESQPDTKENGIENNDDQSTRSSLRNLAMNNNLTVLETVNGEQEIQQIQPCGKEKLTTTTTTISKNTNGKVPSSPTSEFAPITDHHPTSLSSIDRMERSKEGNERVSQHDGLKQEMEEEKEKSNRQPPHQQLFACSGSPAHRSDGQQPIHCANSTLNDNANSEVGTVVIVSDDQIGDYFPYLNTSSNSEEVIEFRKNSWSNMERCIPVEYTSSPIAEVLADSVLNEHPRLSSADFLRVLQGSSNLNFMNFTQSPLKPLSPATSSRTSSTSSNRGSLDHAKSRHSVTSSKSELVPMTGSPQRPFGVSLLEKIIRTHPIWYLQHIGRPASNHLLRPMPAGAFIVRASSRTNSMALTVRLPPTFDQDIDHYLIQRHGSGVRLEGSPNSFKSLPLLIEFYCKHGEELQTKLVLPSAITTCTSTMALQRLALMGQDFWTSEVGRMRSSSTSSSPRKLNRTPPMGTQMLNSHMSQSICSTGPFGMENKNGQLLKQNSIQGDDFYGNHLAHPPQHSFLKKSMSAHDGIHAPIEGLKSNRFDTSSGPQSVRLLSKTSRPVNFLRNLFSQGATESRTTQPHDNSSDKTADPTHSAFVTAYGSNVLAQCEYFSPLPNQKLSGSQSDASNLASGSENQWIKKTSDFRNSSTCKLHQESSAIENTASSLRRSFAKLKTFKPGGSKSDRNAHKSHNAQELFQDDMSHKLTTDAIQARQMAFRREQTDMSNASVQRLIRHQHDESPHAHLRKPLKEYQHQDEGPSYKCCPTNQKNGNGPGPLVPPQGRRIMDSNTMQKCIDELRQKRETCQRMQSSTISSTKFNMDEESKDFMGNKSIEPYEIVMRNRQPNRRADLSAPNLNRHSVPNLNDLSPEIKASASNQSVANSVRALTAKLGRNPGTGELQTINEGLITPVIRRKQFGSATSKANHHGDSETNQRFFQISNECPDFLHQRSNSDSERCAKSTNGNSIATQTLRIPINNTFSTTGTIHSGPTHSASKFYTHSNLQNWTAINSELKTRQRVAKVRPTPHTNPKTLLERSSSKINSKTRNFEEMRSSPSDESPPAKKHSEYAQLSDFTEVPKDYDKSTGSLFLDNSRVIDDDNVSVAGTVFNEPWDSNVWENLLDLAHYGDERPGTASSCSRTHLHTYTNETIEEEQGDDEIICTVEPHDSEAEELESQLTTDALLNMNDDSYGIFGHVAPRPRKSSLTIPSPSKKSTFLTVENKCWKEVSQRIPSDSSSKSSTYDSRRMRSSSLMNVALASNSSEFHNLDGIFSTYGSLQRRAFTPTAAHTVPLTNSIDDFPTVIPSLSPVISPPRLNVQKNTDPARRIQQYVEKISQDNSTVFGSTLKRFVECTIEAEECDPQVVVRNVRQFLNGIKNYLVKHGEGDLHAIIERESARLNSNEFLNIDAILEAILHKILLVPIKAHLYHLMVREHSKNGALQSLSENLSRVRAMSSEQLGFPEGTIMPDSRQMEQIKICLRQMQHHYSPLKKLESLLKALSFVICPNTYNRRPIRHGISNNSRTNKQTKKLPPVDVLIRWLVYIMARTSSVGCEVEAWYMWELLPQQLLTTGDAAYYLTTLFSAIHVLKNPDSLKRLQSGSPDSGFIHNDSHSIMKNGVEEAPDAFIRVAVPDETQGSIEYHMFPPQKIEPILHSLLSMYDHNSPINILTKFFFKTREHGINIALPHMNASKLCRVIAHQFAITNPEDYGLYILFDGFETCLLANEFPDVVRDQLNDVGKPYLFAYKRHEAKIAWPKNVVQVCSTSSSLDIHEQRARQQARALNRT